MKTKGSKLLIIEKAKNEGHLHKATTAGTTGQNKGLKKRGLKMNKKVGGTRAKHGYYS